MKPQERHAAIMHSKLEPRERFILIALSSFMSDDQLAVWCAPESLAELTGYALSAVKATLADLVSRGIITRTDEGKRAKVTRIVWSVLAAVEAKPALRGGKRQRSEHRTDPSDNRTPPSEHRTVAVQTPDGQPSKHRTRSDHGSDHYPTRDTISPTAAAAVAPLPAPALASPEAQPSPPPAPPATTPRPTKPSKAPKPEPRACPGYSEAIALWTRLHREAFPGIAAYPWLFGGRDSDAPRVKLWLAAVHIGPEAAPERVADGLAALDTGIRAYLARVATGTAWPAGEPATTRVFTRDLSRWLQTDPDGATSTGPPSKLAAAFQGTQRFLDRHRDEENVDGIF